MKRNKYLAILLTICMGMISCSDDLDDELFYKFVYFSNNGWQDCEVILDSNNTAELKFYFGINGTSDNDTEVKVKVDIDRDTLAGYNFDRFRYQEQYYYPELPVVAYTFDQEVYTIRHGEIKTTAVVSIDMNKIDNPYKEYVLPLKIISSTGVPVGPGGYTKLLANVLFTNAYSGQYSGAGKLYEVGPENYSMDVSGAKLYATSTNSCYMYAGNVTRSNTDEYWNYAINVRFESDDTITMWTENEDLQFEPIKAEMEEKFTLVTTDERYYNRALTLELEYRYRDLGPDEDRTLEYSGTISISKQVLKTDFPGVTVEE